MQRAPPSDEPAEAARSRRDGRDRDGADPARAAGHRPARGGAGARGAALRAAVARADAGALRARLRGLARGRRRGGRVERHRRAAPRRCARWAGARATRSSRPRSASSRPPTACSTRAPTPVFCDIDPLTLNIDPGRRRGGVRRADGRDLLPVAHLRLPGRHAGARGARRASAGSASSRTPARRSAPSTPRASRVGARGNPAAFAFYANKQLATGEGGMLVPPDAERRRAAAQRAQPGPRATTWTGSRTTGSASTTGSPTSRRRSAWRSSSALDAHARRARAGWPRSTASAWRERSRALVLPCAAAAAERRSWFVYVVQLPEGVDRDAVIAALAERGIASQGLPAVHPPAAVLPGAVRLQGRRVPGRRARRAALAGAAVLSGLSEQQADRVCAALSAALEA